MKFRGSMGLKSPMRGPTELHRAHQKGENRLLFFIWRSLKTPEKIVPFCCEDLFFIFSFWK